ncbi:hypothetical protein [Capnocytophaga stomatis]|uniref:Uncharacterized protein n=1 Tax=Capnocytophaga stomatis TaxID=1848904 RepID=A0ABW8QCS0_9FLAO|nr:hypothetical protein [Capnocytophaga stomatis]GIJ95211.1 hypothetical protein CAPN002_24290 [Capnocytophaga stomatis]
MRIVKGKLFRPKKCEFGDFELVPEKGWKLSETFLDFESGLLVVKVSDENENNWEDFRFARRVPTKQYIIDLEKLEILPPMKWKEYFCYEKVVIVSEDKKFKLTSQRIHKPEENTDLFYEELEFLEKGYKSTSTNIAFQQEKRENLLECVLREIKEKQEEIRNLNAKLTLDEFCLQQLKKIQQNDVIIGYFNDNNVFQLIFQDNVFNLFVGDRLTKEYGALISPILTLKKTYDSIESFWSDFSRNDKWYLEFTNNQSISQKILVLSKHIVSFFNNLRRNHNFTYEEYNKINEWENSVWSDEYKKTEHKQWCSNCYKEVSYYGRYPKYICKDCASKEKFDKNGNLIDDVEVECVCFIDGKEYFAEEARFGGMVIQRKE